MPVNSALVFKHQLVYGMLCIQSKKRRVMLFSSVSAAAENVTVNTVYCSGRVFGAAEDFKHRGRCKSISAQESIARYPNTAVS